MNRRTFLATGLGAGAAAGVACAATPQSTAERNKSLARRFTEDLWAKGDEALIEELLAPDFVSHDPFPGMAPNREGEKQLLRMHSAAFADAEATIDDQIAEGDKVVTRWTFRATHKGKFMGVAPTGKRVKITGINIHRVRDGKIVELWREKDVLGLMQQLGAMPRRRKKRSSVEDRDR